MSNAFFWLICATSGFVGSAILTRFLVGWASRIGALDKPNHRSSHTKVTPRGGGLSIVVVTVIAGVSSAAVWQEVRPAMLGVVGAALAIAYISWLDDLKPLRNRVRFGVHLLSAFVASMAAGPIEAVDMGGLGTLDLGFAAWPLSLLWIVGMTNAFNFMDGVDGIAGITAATAGFSLAIASAWLGSFPVAVVACSFASASIGFLTRNWPPAKIFMGDVGSAFCGFIIAALPAVSSRSQTSRLITVTLFAMWPFVFDTIYTILRRFSKGENIFRAHRSHLYQRLVIAGWSHRAASSLFGHLAAMAAVISLSPFCFEKATPALTALAVIFLPASAIFLLVLVLHAESPCRSLDSDPRLPN